MNRQFKTTGGYPGGFVTDIDGFLCFILPQAEGGQVSFQWAIEEGGGWTHRGGEHVVRRAEGVAYSTDSAEESMERWVENQLGLEAGIPLDD